MEQTRGAKIATTPLERQVDNETVTNGGQNIGSWEVWSTTMSTLERDYDESLRAFHNAGRRSARPASQDDLTVVRTPRDETSRYGTVI